MYMIILMIIVNIVCVCFLWNKDKEISETRNFSRALERALAESIARIECLERENNEGNELKDNKRIAWDRYNEVISILNTHHDMIGRVQTEMDWVKISCIITSIVVLAGAVAIVFL